VIVRPIRHRLVLAALLAGVAGCGGRAAHLQTTATGSAAPSPAPATLKPAPAAVATACSGLARSRVLPVRCPARLPSGRWTVNHRTLRNGRCAYLLDMNTRPFGKNVPFHALAGGRCGRWPLTTRAGHWPADPALADDLGLIGARPLRPGQPSTTTPTAVPPRVLRRVVIGGHRGLLLQEATFPDGGVHGGHIAAIWNQGSDGYVLSLHFSEHPRAPTATWRQIVIDTAAAMSRSPTGAA
jgi:hypothetical protein